MGNADYHPSPVVLICPFDSCKKSHRVLNGVSAVSQLYSHWKGRHASNPMAIALEKRWRLALDNKHKSKEWLDAQPGCALCPSPARRPIASAARRQATSRSAPPSPIRLTSS